MVLLRWGMFEKHQIAGISRKSSENFFIFCSQSEKLSVREQKKGHRPSERRITRRKKAGLSTQNFGLEENKKKEKMKKKSPESGNKPVKKKPSPSIWKSASEQNRNQKEKEKSDTVDAQAIVKMHKSISFRGAHNKRHKRIANLEPVREIPTRNGIVR